jgi:hypothetical protein
LNPSTKTYVQNAKVALSMKENAYDFSANGSAVVGDTTGTYPAPTRLFFGAYREHNGPTNSEHMNGVIKKFLYYDKKLSNAELQALTENN